MVLIKRILLQYLSIFKFLPSVRCYLHTKGTAAPISFRGYFKHKCFPGRVPYWPTDKTSRITGVKNILIGKGTAPGLSPGCYIQGIGKITIGDYTIIATNVGIISANHNLYDYRQHEECSVNIGSYCWIGMNSVILPGVCLGDHTIVAAGAVVTKPFPEGYQVIGGNPAKVIKRIDRNKCINYANKFEYTGFYSPSDFLDYKSKYLIKI